MKLEVSTRHLKLRIVLAVVLFFVIVTSFTVGILSIGHKESGYQDITGDTDAEALNYNNWVTFRYYLEGSSNQIKQGIRQLKEDYTPILASAYKETDANNTYYGHVSIAAINQNLGQVVSVSPELYAILKDAYQRTLEKKGFNLFAGALYGEWESILIVADAEEFDPLNNDYQSQRIKAIAEMVSDLSNFSLEFLNDTTCAVRLTLSDKYAAFVEEYELEEFPVLDLNVLQTAYRLQMMAQKLVNAGYTKGYLATGDGFAISMDPEASLEYGMYTFEAGEKRKYSSLQLEGVFSAATIEAFKDRSPYAYTLETEEGRLFRNIWFNVYTGEQNNLLMNLSVMSQDMDIVQNAMEAVAMNMLSSEKDVAGHAESLKEERLVSYILQNAR